MKDNKLLLLDKGSVSQLAADLVEAVNNGETNPLEAYVAIKHMEEVCKLANKALKEQAIEEASKHGPESRDLQLHGAQIQVKNGAGRWNFKAIPEVVKAEEDLKALKERHKQAYKMSERGDQMVSEHGELIKPAGFYHGGEVIAVKLLK